MASKDQIKMEHMTVQSNMFKPGTQIRISPGSVTGIFTTKKTCQFHVLSGRAKGIQILTKQKLSNRDAVTIPNDGKFQIKNESNSSYCVTFK